MKETGIIMSAPMVKALLDGSKTQTRRIVKPQPNEHGFWRHGTSAKCDDCGDHFRRAPRKCQCGCTLFKSIEYPITKCLSDCPYGVPGDRLWVREKIFLHNHFAWPRGESNQHDVIWARIWSYAADHLGQESATGARPSIFMPRWASRITLELTRVRVERLQDITEGDAFAEGCIQHYDEFGKFATEQYAALWDSLHGKGAWERNDWVWVLLFRKQ